MLKKPHNYLVWNPEDTQEVAFANNYFDEQVENGYLFYDPDGNRIKVFDPNIEMLKIIPPMVGG